MLFFGIFMESTKEFLIFTISVIGLIFYLTDREIIEKVKKRMAKRIIVAVYIEWTLAETSRI